MMHSNIRFKLILMVGFLLAINVKPLTAQTITNIQPKLVGNFIFIDYEIKEARFDQQFDVNLYVSYDGGKTYNGPMTLVPQKEAVKGGKNQLVWNVFKDIDRLDGNYKFDIRANVSKVKLKKQFFLQYSAGALVSSTHYITPFGLRLGMLGQTGWYMAGYFNTFQKADIDFDGESYSEPIFYETTEEKLYPLMVFTAGLTYQIGYNSHLFAGAGYGIKRYYTQINILDVEGNLIESGKWVNMLQHEENGIEFEGGYLYCFNKFNFSVGVSSFNFKYLGVNAGVGIKF